MINSLKKFSALFIVIFLTRLFSYTVFLEGLFLQVQRLQAGGGVIISMGPVPP